MAKIIYKKGCEGQNRLESIEGIEIEMLNGQKALIYPKYSEEVMLPVNNIKDYVEFDTEIDALKKISSKGLTDALYNDGSPAAEFVRHFYSEIFDKFNLPTLLTAMEIQDQKEDIDKLAETIEGADLLRDFTSHVWSCSQCGVGAWVVYGYSGLVCMSSLRNSYLAVPTILY